MSEETKTGNPTLAVVPDPYDVDNLILPQSYTPVGKKEIRRIRVKKPHRHAWIRVHPEFSIPTMLFFRQYDTERVVYLVARNMWDVMRDEGKSCMLYLYTTRDRAIYLWPVRMEDPITGRIDTYSETAHDAAARATETWVRVASNQKESIYDVIALSEEKARAVEDPVWPDEILDVKNILELAFKDKIIDSIDHAAIRDLELGACLDSER